MKNFKENTTGEIKGSTYAGGGEIYEIRSDFEDNGEVYIDVYFSDDENEAGVVIATVNVESGKVTFKDEWKDYESNSLIQEEIDYVLKENNLPRL